MKPLKLSKSQLINLASLTGTITAAVVAGAHNSQFALPATAIAVLHLISTICEGFVETQKTALR